MITTNRQGTILTWNDKQGHSILYPSHRRNDRKERGGAFACVPVFGAVPNDLNWAGVTVPQHGLLRRWSEQQPVEIEESVSDHSLIRTFGFRVSQASFPWSFYAVCRIIDSMNYDQVIYQLSVTRSFTCQNPRPMPLSLGFHPYFATGGSKVRVLHGGKTMATTEDDLSHRYFEIEAKNLCIETESGIVHMNPISGFDRMYVWSDDPLKYLCVEPTLGKREPILLRPGENRSCLCVMNYVPHP